MFTIPLPLVNFFRVPGGVLHQSVDGRFATSIAPRVVFPGSFNPLHVGHRTLATVAGRRFGCEVHFELSVTNPDKPEMSVDDVATRLAQFIGVGPVWVTRAATFEKKVDLFPGAAFVLGYDTAVRLIDPRYYGGKRGRDEALRKLIDRECRVIVGGRVDDQGEFRVWEHRLSGDFLDLFEVIPEREFRMDVSSTALRGAVGHGGEVG